MRSILERKRTLTPQQVEEIYGIHVGTLNNMRFQKRGPRHYRLGDGPGKRRRRILYFVEDVEAYIRRNCQRSFQTEPFSVVKSEPPCPDDWPISTSSFPTFPRSR